LTFREDRRVMVGEESVGVDVLAERIRQALLTRSDKQVYLRGDGAVQYQELVTVWDELKAAGVDNIGMVTDLPRQLRQP
jgi:biopolymer transport protein ExbD